MSIGLLRSSMVLICVGLVSILGLTGCSLDLAASSTTESDAQSKTMEFSQFEPNSSLSPEDVVRIQVEALQNNNRSNEGIKVTFKFASPANKQVTGPLTRFIRLVNNPVYRPMLNHKRATYSPIEISGDTAVQRVTITGSDSKSTVYLFQLSRQTDPTCNNCWMTDSVSVAPTKKQQLNEA